MKICVLYGGWSAERPISLLSGRAVAAALEEGGHAVTRVDPRDASLSDIPEDTHVVFILLHGGFGEGGEAQAVLEERGIPYTGSGVAASKLAMDKAASRVAFQAAGLHVAPGLTVRVTDPVPDPVRIEKEIGPMPWFVKPTSDGSSLGVSKVKVAGDFRPALEKSFGIGPVALVERGIVGREFTVSILEGSVLPIIELKPDREFYDYTAKYAPDGGTRYVVFPTMALHEEEAVRDAGVRAFSALGCRGAGRVDVILGAGGVPYVLEVNTIPGMTEKSLLPKAAAAVGISYGQLCERIAELGLGPKTTE